MTINGPQKPIPIPVPQPIKVERKVLEKHVEQFLIKKMKDLGGECYKWHSQNVRFVTDRICVFPNGTTALVELKRDVTCKLSTGQAKFHARMKELNVPHVYVLHSKEEVSQWISSMGY